MSANSLFKVDSITVNGAALAIVDGSATISGVTGFEAEVVVSASGPDYEQYKRVPRVLDMQIQFGPSVEPAALAGMRNARVVLKDVNGPRRAMCPNCSYASMGQVGKGPVDLKVNILEAIQWL